MTPEGHQWASVTNGYVIALPSEEMRDQLILLEAESLVVTPEQALEEFRSDPEFSILERCAYVLDDGKRVMPRFKSELLKGLLTREHAREGTLEDAVREGKLISGAITEAAREAARLTGLSFRTTKCWVVKNSTILGPKDVEGLRRLGKGIPFFEKAYKDREVGGSFYYGVQALRRLEYRVLNALQRRGRNGDGGVGEKMEFGGLSKFHTLVDRLAARIFNRHYEQISEDVIAKRVPRRKGKGKREQAPHSHDFHLGTTPITTPTAPPGTEEINAQIAYEVFDVLDNCLNGALQRYLAKRQEQNDFNFEAYKTLFQDGVVHRFTGRHLLDQATLRAQASYAKNIVKRSGKLDRKFVDLLVNEFTRAVDTGEADASLHLPEGTLARALRAHGEYARVQPSSVHDYRVLLIRVAGKPLDEVVDGERLSRRERREMERDRKADYRKAQKIAGRLLKRPGSFRIDVARRDFLLPAYARAQRLEETTAANRDEFLSQARAAGQEFYTYGDARRLLEYAGVPELANVVRGHYAAERGTFMPPSL